LFHRGQGIIPNLTVPREWTISLHSCVERTALADWMSVFLLNITTR
jgi:hypothetical protein